MDDSRKNQEIYNSDFNNVHQDSVKPTLSLVIPAYFEEGNLKLLYVDLAQILKEIKISWEMIIVDDGSNDKTWDEICELNEIDKRVKGLRFARNFGHQYAIFAGLNFASGKSVITMDADMQHPPHVIPKLIEEWKRGYKIVNTIRCDDEKTKFSKRLTSKWFYKVFSYLTGVSLHWGMADFRLLDEQVVREFMKFRESDIFFRGLVAWSGFKSANIMYKSGERLLGKTKYNLKKMIRFGWTGIISFSLAPLRIGVILGIITSIFSFSQLILALYDHFVLNVTVPGWTTLVVLTTFLFSILFVILGIIGEYIGRILIETRNRPRFIISDFLGLNEGKNNSDGFLNQSESISQPNNKAY